ncbi:putative DNA-binding transcriptional regulator YafY [Paenibacillus castaneae]|uniref:helix-turn-helix transcriptional regulator n=1 Tax=Paenibacillus castaneae TaxID=474957 RepID=UPI000C9CA434|nr:YafY family protein [Paenibacillus castaneae]NIK79115.1 putative DNA-binding transcriptional regulator YafY [Paenibacillus castaneae]
MKIDRLLAMTVLLLNRERMSAKELAERFEVSTKTIYRDMDTLNQAGIPIFARQGTLGGFEIMEQFTLSRQYLSLSEITSVIAAVKGISSALDDDTFASLHEKVASLLTKSDKRQSEQRGEGIIFDLNPWGQGPAARHKVNELKQAIEELKRIKVTYINMNGTESTRVVEPYALILKGNIWYLHGYCTLRHDFRVFRLSRIQELHTRMETFERRTAPSLSSYAWKSEWSPEAKTNMTLLFCPKVRYRALDTFPPDQVTILEDGSLRVQGEFALDEWFYGMLLSYGDNVKVEQPSHAAEEMIRRARNILKRYLN